MKKNLLFSLLLAGAFLAGCVLQPATTAPVSATPTVAATITPTVAPTASPTLTPTFAPTATPTAGLDSILPDCGLAPIAVPTSAVNPGDLEIDPSTGLHMTGRPVRVDVTNYRLRVTGLVDHPLSLTYDNLRCMPKVTARLDLECIGFFKDAATWSGVPIKYILDLAGLKSEAKYITMIAADRYESQMFLEVAQKDANFLAYEQEGQPLPILHGFPLRAVFPGMPGNKWVKWLLEIRVE
jgi:DMSO/TMAO reductase YedYZ molybdopterin-dependent catalytic subunit